MASLTWFSISASHFREIKEKLNNVLSRFDHANLNDLEEFKKDNPSSENLAKNIHDKLIKEMPGLKKVTVWESATTCASYSL